MGKKILVIQTAFIGDALLTIPLLKNIKKLYPRSDIHILCRSGLGDVFKQFNLASVVYEYKKGGSSNWPHIKNSIKKNSFDIIISPHESLRTQLLVWSLSAKIKVGFYKWWNFWIFNYRVKRPMHLPEVLRQNMLLTVLSEDFKSRYFKFINSCDIKNIDLKSNIDFSTKNSIPKWAEMHMEESDFNSSDHIKRVKKIEIQYELENKKCIFIAPGSVWSTKRWTEKGFSRLAKKMISDGFSVLLIGSPEEFKLCNTIKERAPGSINLAGKLNLVETAYLLRHRQALVSNDSGAMHLGALSSIPVVAIFGPTTPRLGYRPWSDQSKIIQRDLKCRPCGLHGAKVCPLGTHECMVKIDSNDVYRAVCDSLI